MSFAIYHDLLINSNIKNVFKAISGPKHLINWWPKKCEGIAKLNEEYNFYFTAEYDWYGKVIKLEENKAFHIQMTKSDADWNSTTFGFELEGNENAVQIKFWHINWPVCNAHYRRSSYCWAILLQGLKNYVEKGIIVPFDERE
jgi:uncharacterized protein YndB with AHSA1/START domain